MFDLGLVPDQCFKFVESVGNDATDLRERWDNRVVLERSSVAELYINGRIEILIYGEWSIGSNNFEWLCRVKVGVDVADGVAATSKINPPDTSYGDCRDDEVMFVVIAEGVEGPKRLIRSIGRTYLIEKKVCRTGEGCLYRLEVANGRPTGGYKVFPIGPHGEVPFRLPCYGLPYASGQVVQRPAKVVDSIADDERKKFRDWFKWAVLQNVTGRMNLGRSGVQLNLKAVPFSEQRACQRDHFVNVAIGPLNF